MQAEAKGTSEENPISLGTLQAGQDADSSLMVPQEPVPPTSQARDPEAAEENAAHEAKEGQNPEVEQLPEDVPEDRKDAPEEKVQVFDPSLQIIDHEQFANSAQVEQPIEETPAVNPPIVTDPTL